MLKCGRTSGAHFPNLVICFAFTCELVLCVLSLTHVQPNPVKVTSTEIFVFSPTNMQDVLMIKGQVGGTKSRPSTALVCEITFTSYTCRQRTSAQA